MTTQWMFAGCLALAALAAAWPARSSLHRLAGHPPNRLPTLLSASRTHLTSRPRQTIAVAASALACLGWLLAGPVAGLVAAVYGSLALRAFVRRQKRTSSAAQRAATLDALAGLAADLRAGLPPATLANPLIGAPAGGRDRPAGAALLAPGLLIPGGRSSGSAGVSPAATADRTATLLSSVWRLAERTGAPAADIVERIEADARAEDRSKASAAAEAAGAQTTALLLAMLPLGGIGLGYGIGADPLQVLLHTTLGGLCAAGAVLLQTIGLLWADRLTSGGPR